MMGHNAAVQALQKAEKLKEKVVSSNDLLNDGEAWMWQQQLQAAYQQVLLLDLEYALDQKVEQELWNFGFKNYIGLLQNLVKDRKNAKRSESQALLTWCLESASGFYLSLLQEICSTFDLDLTFRRNGSVYGSNDGPKVSKNGPAQPHKNSCSYICQHCLVHLGDIARYRNQNRQAESFYRHAVQVSPTSGQPYNQLALLDSSRGDRLGTVFHYIRSIAVRHLFPAATTNLARTLNKCAQEQINTDGRNRLSAQDCVALFLKLHGLLHVETSDLSSCTGAIRLLTDTLTAHVATETFTSRKLTQMLAVNLFALQETRCGAVSDNGERTIRTDEGATRALILDLVAGSLCSLLLPVYTLREGDTLLDYFALPTIKLTLDWIRMEPRALTEAAFQTRPQMWPSLCRLLNGLQPALALFTGSATHYSAVPLPEDRELQGFLPLESAMSGLRFTSEDSKIEPSDLNKLRASRLLQFGEWLSKRDQLGFVTAREEADGGIVFEAASSGQAPSSELLRELEQLSLAPKQSPSPSDLSSGSGSGSATASTPDLLVGPASPSPQPQNEIQEITLQLTEKRAGILKPQGSLEKSREKEAAEHANGGVSAPSGKKARQNVAMQAIMRKGAGAGRQGDADAKQVSFKTPSPPSSQGNEKRGAWPARPQAQRASASSASSTRAMPAMPPSPAPLTVPPPSLPNNFVAPLEPHMLRPPFGPWLDESQNQLSKSVGFRQHNGPLGGTYSGPVHLVPDPSLRGPINAPPPDIPVGMGLPVNVNPPASPRSWWPTSLEQDPNSSQGFAPPVVNMFMNESGRLGGRPTSLSSQQVSQSHANAPPGLVNHWGPVQQHSPQNQVNQVNQVNQGRFPSMPYLQQQEPLDTQNQRKDAFPATANFSSYSLFSSNSWLPPGQNPEAQERVGDGPPPAASLVPGQSLWSGPGPSPLERLLEQQKLLREGPAPKGGT